MLNPEALKPPVGATGASWEFGRWGSLYTVQRARMLLMVCWDVYFGLVGATMPSRT